MKQSADQGTKIRSTADLVVQKEMELFLAEIPFSKDEVIDAASALGLRIKNLADVIYTYRSRRPMPREIRRTGNWVIAARGSGLYAFVKVAGETTVTIPESLKV